MNQGLRAHKFGLALVERVHNSPPRLQKLQDTQKHGLRTSAEVGGPDCCSCQALGKGRVERNEGAEVGTWTNSSEGGAK